MSAEDKSAIISQITKPIGGDKTVKNLLEALAENNRLGLIGNVIDKFTILMGAHRGEVEAIITSATVGYPQIHIYVEFVNWKVRGRMWLCRQEY